MIVTRCCFDFLEAKFMLITDQFDVLQGLFHRFKGSFGFF